MQQRILVRPWACAHDMYGGALTRAVEEYSTPHSSRVADCVGGQADKRADAVAHKHVWPVNKLGSEVQQLVSPQVDGVIQGCLVRRPKSEKVNGIHLQR